MTGGVVLKAAAGGVTRRRVQTAVVFAVVTAAAAVSVLGLTLATSSNAAFQASFTARHGAHLAVTVNRAKVTSASLASTGRLPGVTRAAGPYPETTITISLPGGRGGGQVTVVGRASPSGPLNVIAQATGRWPTRQGELVLAGNSQARGSLGQVVTGTVTSVRGRPSLIIVGYAGVFGADEGDGWATPGEVSALERVGAPAREEMLYTFTHASTPAQVSADLRELRAALPPGAITGSTSWLGGATSIGAAQGSGAPSAEAYAVIGLLLAAVIIASVAAGAVAAGYRRIGVIKSIGFTPAQVVTTYLAQLGIPALAGSAAGTAAGNRWVLPLIDGGGPGTVAVAVPLWINITVPAGMLALIALAALVPALRAGMQPAAAVIEVGRAPRADHGHAAHRLAGRLPLPRPVTAGLAVAFTRPARSAATLATIACGLAAVVLAAGLATSMTGIVASTGRAYLDAALVQRLTLLVAVLAAAGVFSAVLMQARERVHDLGIFKALGMTPRQVIVMVACWAVIPAIAAIAIALPAGIALEGAVAREVVSAQISPLEKILPPGALSKAAHPPRGASSQPPKGPGQLLQNHLDLVRIYTPGRLALLALAGLAIALAGALGPAAWAAASRTTRALAAE